MSKHEELIERLRCFDRVTCNEAADALEAQAREIEGLNKEYGALIRQMLEALEASLPDLRGLALISPTAAEHAERHAAAIKAGRARLEGKP